MSMLLDGLIALTVLYFMAVSYKNGVVKSVLSLVSLAASYVLANMFSPALSGVLQKLHIADLFTKNMDAALTQSEKVLPGLTTAADSFVSELVATTGTEALLDKSGELIDMLYTDRVTSILAFIIIFFVANTAIRIAINLLNVVAMLPVIGSVNRFFGLIFGIIEGAAMCYVLCLIVSLIISVTGDSLGILSAIPQTTAFKIFYNHNILAALLPWKL